MSSCYVQIQIVRARDCTIQCRHIESSEKYSRHLLSKYFWHTRKNAEVALQSTMCTVQLTIYAQHKNTRHPKKSINSTLVAGPKCFKSHAHGQICFITLWWHHCLQSLSTLLSDECFVRHQDQVRVTTPLHLGLPRTGQLSTWLPSWPPAKHWVTEQQPATSHPIQSRADGGDSVHSKQVVCLLTSTNHGPGARLSANQRAGWGILHRQPATIVLSLFELQCYSLT